MSPSKNSFHKGGSVRTCADAVPDMPVSAIATAMAERADDFISVSSVGPMGRVAPRPRSEEHTEIGSHLQMGDSNPHDLAAASPSSYGPDTTRWSPLAQGAGLPEGGAHGAVSRG